MNRLIQGIKLLLLLTITVSSVTHASDMIKPKITTLDTFNVVGIQVTGSPSDGSFGQTWPALFARHHEVKNDTGMQTSYGIQSYSETSLKTGIWEYTAGLETKMQQPLPKGMTLIEVPANQYAVFVYKGAVGPKLGELFRAIYQQWLPTSGYALAGSYDFEKYDERFKGPQNPDSILEIYIPIKKIPPLPKLP